MDRGININRCSASCRTWWLELFGTSATRVSRSLALLRDRTRGPRFSINGSITQTVSLLLSARSRSIRINRLLYRGGKRRKESAIAILAKILSYRRLQLFYRRRISSLIIPHHQSTTRAQRNKTAKSGMEKFSLENFPRGFVDAAPRRETKKIRWTTREGRR